MTIDAGVGYVEAALVVLVVLALVASFFYERAKRRRAHRRWLEAIGLEYGVPMRPDESPEVFRARLTQLLRTPPGTAEYMRMRGEEPIWVHKEDDDGRER